MVSSLQAAMLTFVVGLSGLGLKYLAYVETQSVALYSDALESIVNVVAALLLIFTVMLSNKPADKNHHFGHQKIEYLAALFESLCILVAAVTVVVEAIKGIYQPHSVSTPMAGLFLNGLATLLNTVWGFYLVYKGRHERSPALYADGVHLLADVFSSICVAVGLLLAVYTGMPLLDPIVALAVGIHLFVTGLSLSRQAIDGLMDAVLDPKEYEHIVLIINNNLEFALQAHDIKVRHSGKKIFIEFHLVFDGFRTVKEAHSLCDRIEAHILKDYPLAEINIHLEPEDCLEILTPT